VGPSPFDPRLRNNIGNQNAPQSAKIQNPERHEGNPWIMDIRRVLRKPFGEATQWG
jgi:hypothetical protein